MYSGNFAADNHEYQDSKDCQYQDKFLEWYEQFEADLLDQYINHVLEEGENFSKALFDEWAFKQWEKCQ